MASTDATYFPVKGQAYRLTRVFTLVNTGKESSGSLSPLTAWISQEGTTFLPCANAPFQVGLSGVVRLDLTAAEMNADTVIIKLSSTLANTVDVISVLMTVDLSEVAGRPDSAVVKKLERFLLSLYRRWFNRRSQNRSTGAFTQYLADESTVDVQGTVTQASDTITVGESG